ncbi:MAG: hypothetical protein NTW78_12915 [Campylobacterales bacterium]|nr:hypothetical protein [Campylobacterales bacterium]
MNINSMTQSSNLAQMQSNSKVQSQSSASGMAPESKSSSMDKVQFSEMAMKLAQNQSADSNQMPPMHKAVNTNNLQSILMKNILSVYSS